MTNTWSSYFDNHDTREDYNKSCKTLAKLIKPKESNFANFRLLSENPTTTLLFKSQLGHQIQSIHTCSILANRAIDRNPRLMGLMGFGDRAIPVQINEKTIFPPPTTAFPSPSFLDLMKIKSAEDVDKLTHNNQTKKGNTKPSVSFRPSSHSAFIQNQTTQ